MKIYRKYFNIICFRILAKIKNVNVHNFNVNVTEYINTFYLKKIEGSIIVKKFKI